MKYIKYKKIAFVLASCLSATATLPSGYEEFKGLKTQDCLDVRGFDEVRGASVYCNYFRYYPSVKTSSEKYSSWLYENFEQYSTFQSMVTESSYAQVHNWDDTSVLKVAVLAALRGSKGAEYVDAIVQKYSDDSQAVEEIKTQVKEAGLEFSEEELNSKNLFGQGMFLQKLLRDHDNANLERENESLKSALEKFSKSSETAEKGDFKFVLPEGYEEFKGLKTHDCRDVRGFDESRGAFIFKPLFGGSESFILFDKKSNSLNHKYSNWLRGEYGSYSSFQDQMNENCYAQVADWDKISVLKVAVLAALRASKGAEYVDAIVQKYSYDSQAVEELKTQVKEGGIEFSEEELNSKRLFNQALFLQNLLRDQNNANLESEKDQLVSENKSLKSKLAKMDKDFETTEKMLNQERADFKFTVEGLKFESKKVNEELERVKEEFKLNEAELSKENAELVERLSQVQKEFIDETRRLEDVNEELGIDVREAEEAFHVAFAQISGKVDDILKTLGKIDADLEDLNLNEKLMMLKSGAEDSHWVFA